MSKHVGSVGSKISVQVTLTNEFEYVDYKFSFHGTTHYTYIMEDAEGNVYVWKTTSVLVFEADNDHGRMDCIRKGDTMMISGTVKEHGEFKGVQQTVLTRCKFSLVAHKPDEVVMKREHQMQSLEEGDVIFEMPYKQYKEHYSDCETVSGSFDKEKTTIRVIIRKGRMKNSGVRGKHFSGFEFRTKHGERVCYRAVSEENARKQLEKDFPNSADWECTHIYRHASNYREFY